MLSEHLSESNSATSGRESEYSEFVHENVLAGSQVAQKKDAGPRTVCDCGRCSPTVCWVNRLVGWVDTLFKRMLVY